MQLGVFGCQQPTQPDKPYVHPPRVRSAAITYPIRRRWQSAEHGSASGRVRAGGYFSFSAKLFGHSPHMTIIATIYSLPLPGGPGVSYCPPPCSRQTIRARRHVGQTRKTFCERSDFTRPLDRALQPCGFPVQRNSPVLNRNPSGTTKKGAQRLL